MVVTVGFLYAKSQKVYKMQCLTGTQGFDSRVSWIHIIENKESALFLHGGELVFARGVSITAKSGCWIISRSYRKAELADW